MRFYVCCKYFWKWGCHFNKISFKIYWVCTWIIWDFDLHVRLVIFFFAICVFSLIWPHAVCFVRSMERLQILFMKEKMQRWCYLNKYWKVDKMHLSFVFLLWYYRFICEFLLNLYILVNFFSLMLLGDLSKYLERNWIIKHSLFRKNSLRRSWRCWLYSLIHGMKWFVWILTIILIINICPKICTKCDSNHIYDLFEIEMEIFQLWK